MLIARHCSRCDCKLTPPTIRPYTTLTAIFQEGRRTEYTSCVRDLQTHYECIQSRRYQQRTQKDLRRHDRAVEHLVLSTALRFPTYKWQTIDDFILLQARV